MKSKLSRRIFLSQMLFAIAACTTEKTITNQRLVIGVIGYGQGKQTVERFNDFRKYLSENMKTMIELEPAFNERIAMERMKRKSWSLVFSTPGLAAIGIDKYQYWSIFPLELGGGSRSIIVVNQGSGLNNLKELQGKRLALGQQGSATGYYLPLFNLYGLTLTSVKFAATPLSALEWLAAGEVDAAALSSTDFNKYKTTFNSSRFRILFSDSHTVPSGSLLCSPLVEKKRADLIRNYLKKAPASLIQKTRYIPTESPPDYKYMINVVKKVNTIAENIDSKPVRLFN